MRLNPTGFSTLSVVDTDGWWTDLLAAVVEAWPEIDGKLYRAPSLNRQSLINLIKDSKVAAPFVVIEVGKERADDAWSRDLATYQQPVSITYVCATNDSRGLVDSDDPAKSYDIETLVYNQAQTLKLKLIGWHGSGSALPFFQCVPPWPAIDSESWSFANQIMLKANYPMFCGTLDAQLLVGDSAP